MSWELLPVNYTDAVWNGLKKYIEVDNGDGSVSFQDVTQYTNKENSFFGAYDANRMNEALNRIMSMVENGTDLYEAFTNYFNEQKQLFESASNTELSEYSDDLDSLRANATTRFNSFNTYVANLQQQGDDAIETIKTDYSEEIADFETNQEQAFNIWFEAIRDRMSGDIATNLQNQIDEIVNNKVLFDIVCPEVTLGATITVTDGTTTKTAVVDSTLHVTFGFPDAGTYTLSDSFTGSSVQIEALHYGLYPVNLRMGIIRVTVPEGFAGKRITVTNGTDSYSRLVGASDTVLTFGAPTLGEWTVSNNFTDETFTVNVADYITYQVIFHIATLTVTCDSSYETYDISVTNGTLAYTETVPSSGVVKFYIPTFGNWTVSNTLTTDTQIVNVQAYSTYACQFGIVGIKFGKLCSLLIAFPEILIIIKIPLVCGNPEEVPHIYSSCAFLVCKKSFIHLLPMADSDHLYLVIRIKQFLHRLCKYLNSTCRRFLNHDISGFRILKCKNDKLHSFFQAHDKPCHRRLRYRKRFPLFYLFYKQRNDRASRTHNISVSRSADKGLIRINGP